MELMRQIVLEHARRAFAAGLFAGTSGNLSVRDPERGLMAITASGVRYETMGPQDIVLLNVKNGQPVTAAGPRPSSETAMHLYLYRHRPDIHAIVHTHSPYATAFAAGGQAIPCALVEMVFFLGGSVEVAPLALPGSEAVGRGAAATLEHRHACLLEQHGVVAVGGDMASAYLRAEYTEDAAKICLLARQNGSLKELDPALQARLLEG